MTFNFQQQINGKIAKGHRTILAAAGLTLLHVFNFVGTLSVLPARAQEPAQEEAALNFVQADIASVIKAVGHYTGTTFIIDPRVKGSIDLVSEKPVKKSQALKLLASILRLQGYAIVQGTDFAKVVPEVDAKIQMSAESVGKVRGDQIDTQIFHLNYELANNLLPTLRPLISPNNTISANTSTNTLTITDYANNLHRLGKIIAALDNPASSEPDIIPIQYAIASDIAIMLDKLLDANNNGANMASGESRLIALADSRTNSIILRAPSTARANLVRSLIARLDVPTANPGNVHVVPLRNADAVKLAQTLRAVISFDATALNKAAGVKSTSSLSASLLENLTENNVNATASAANPLASGSAMSAARDDSKNQTLSSDSTSPAGFIQADQSTNTLIITANEALYRNLRMIIDQLDTRRAQIYIESLIVEVSSTKAAEFGIQWAGLSGNSSSAYRVGGLTSFAQDGNNLVNLSSNFLNNTGSGSLSTAANALTSVLPGAGLSLGIFRQINGRLGLGALAHALESEGGANILSMPNLITLDNEEASIIVGKNVPFVTGQYTTLASGGAAGVNPFQTIERKDIGLSLRVRPQVSEGGTVKLEIYQETSDILSEGSSGIITTKRAINTNVLVDDGQTLVLGGLISDSLKDTSEKVPGLGDIPIIGNAFKYQTRKHEKTNLMVFLRPTVLRSADRSVEITGDRYDFIRRSELERQPATSFGLPAVVPPVLPPLENGQPMGGNLLRASPAILSLPASPLSPASQLNQKER